jgi:hypothetical protein
MGTWKGAIAAAMLVCAGEAAALDPVYRTRLPGHKCRL